MTSSGSADTTDSHDKPLRLALIGLGEMGAVWVSTIIARTDVELVGIVAPRPVRARERARALGCPAPVESSLEALAELVDIDAVVNATPPEVHHATTIDAMARGYDVLSEKPFAQNLSAALSILAHAEISGRLLMVSQSRRYHPALFELKKRMGELGRIGFMTSEFFRAPRFDNFRDEMDHPLLIEMAIHPFDSARFLLGSDPVSVLCEEFNPGWSWYSGAACVSATFEMTSGERYVFVGSWCSEGHETSWNSSWRVSGEAGTALWDGETAPVLASGPGGSLVASSQATDAADPDFHQLHGVDGALEEFVGARASNIPPYGEAHSNILSLAMVEAAIYSSSVGRRVLISDVLARALDAAIANEPAGPAHALLKQWALTEIPLDARTSSAATP